LKTLKKFTPFAISTIMFDGEIPKFRLFQWRDPNLVGEFVGWTITFQEFALKILSLQNL
jgi:hypothetical protein